MTNNEFTNPITDPLAIFYKYLSDQLGNNAEYNNSINSLLDDAYGEIDKLIRTSGSTYASYGDFSPHTLRKNINNLNTYQISQDRIDIAVLAINAAKALQFHVEFYNGDINAYYQRVCMQVSQEFADLSEKAGYPINSENIE